jgi:hypothetical protein
MMNRILFFTLLSFLSGASLLGLNTEAFAGACTICFETSPITHTIHCSVASFYFKSRHRPKNESS